MTGSRSPTACQPAPSWSSDSERAAWRLAVSRSSVPATSPWTVPSRVCQTSTAALSRQPSTGNVMSRPGRRAVRADPGREPAGEVLGGGQRERPASARA